ncbi:hypothetical protein [Dactylosporangium sp. CA-139066]|uniref:hypothetical protein n=1 Tax=Dactylosporangium sp. CA-139066 TaxID=3239930 RepID=UPI003D9001E8
MTTRDMDALTPSQRDVLGAIAIGLDSGHPYEVLVALAEKGLIVGHHERAAGWPPVVVTRWEVPLDVHIRWAAWCSAQPDEVNE